MPQVQNKITPRIIVTKKATDGNPVESQATLKSEQLKRDCTGTLICDARHNSRL